MTGAASIARRPVKQCDALVTACGRICMHRKRLNISTVLAGQRLDIREVDDGIWIVSFMHYDLGCIDLEQKTLQPLDNPFGTRVVTCVLGTFRYLCLRSGHRLLAGGKEIRTAGPTCDEDAGQNTFMRPSRTAPV